MSTSPTAPSTQVQYIQAQLDDQAHTEAILELLNAYAEEPIGSGAPLPPDVRDNLIPGLTSHPGTLVILAHRDNEFIGISSCFTGFSTFKAKPLINIHDIYVRPEHRGRGVASGLINAVEQVAREMDCCKVTLEVRQDNPVAERLYRRLGFGGASTLDSEVQYYFLEKRI
ncbi:MAG: GNAT family N-acetyltransferase [Candidatus Sedimenticola sp. 20ELBAFRAG]